MRLSIKNIFLFFIFLVPLGMCADDNPWKKGDLLKKLRQEQEQNQTSQEKEKKPEPKNPTRSEKQPTASASKPKFTNVLSHHMPHQTVSLVDLQHRNRIWKPSLNIRIHSNEIEKSENENYFNFFSWFKSKKTILDQLFVQGDISHLTGNEHAAQSNVCFGMLSLIVQVKGLYYMVNFDIPAMYLSGIDQLLVQNYSGLPIINARYILRITNPQLHISKNNRDQVFEANKRNIKNLTNLEIKGGSEHAESYMALDIQRHLNNFIGELHKYFNGPVTVLGSIFNILTFQDPCKMGCMPMFFKLPEIIDNQLKQHINQNPQLTFAPVLSNTVLISGINEFKDTRDPIVMTQGEIEVDLSHPQSQVFVATYENTINGGSDSKSATENVIKIKKN